MSYITPAEGTAYFVDYSLIYDAWSDATAAQQQVALNQATEIINTLPLRGYPTAGGQTNQFPRNSDTTVPEEINRACAECAYALLDGVDPESEFRMLEIESTKYANVSTKYSTPRLLMKAYGIPSFKAWKYLVRWIDTPETIKMNKV